MTNTTRSIIGSILILVSTMALAFIVNHHLGGVGWADFTENRRYTLTDGTKSILSKMTRQVKAKLFFTKTAVDRFGTDQLKPFLRAHSYARDLLAEYERHSGGKVDFQEFDPVKFSAAADEAAELGIQIQPLTEAFNFAFGLAVTSDTGAKQVIPFINARDEGGLEYKITKLVERVSQRSKKKIGVIAGLNLMGDGDISPQMRRLMAAQGRQPTPKWNFLSWLEMDYEVQSIEATAKEIPAGIDYLFVIHPKDFKDEILYAIDQYVLRGGKAVMFVDPMCLSDQPPQTPGQNQYAAFMHPRASDLNRLTSAWGVELQTGKVMVDRNVIRTQPGLSYCQFTSRSSSFNEKEPITQELDKTASIIMLYPGALKKVDGTPSEVVSLIHSTAEGGTRQFGNMELMQSQQDPALLYREGDPTAADASAKAGFEAAGATVSVAVRIRGKFKSAFPDGLPGASDANGSEDPAKKDDAKPDGDKPDGDKPDGSKEDKAKDKKVEHVKEAADANSVILLADVDMLSNMVISDPNNWMAQLQGEPSKNRALLLNILDYMAGSNDLISIRSRGHARRNFDRILEIEKEAQARTEKKQDEIRKEIEKFQAELTALQNSATGKSQGLTRAAALTKEREANANIRAKRRELNEVLRESTAAVRSVEGTVKWINTLGMPALVGLIGLILWILRLMKVRNQMREDMA